MSTHAIALTPEQIKNKRRMLVGSFYLFILAEALIFVTLFATRFLLAQTTLPSTLNQGLGIAITAILVLSLVPVWMARGAAQRGESPAGPLWITAGAGALALLAIVYDWVTLDLDVGSRYGENYVLSTGYHALHILLGVIALMVVAGTAQRRDLTPEKMWIFDAAVIFWSFIAASWVALYIVFFVA